MKEVRQLMNWKVWYTTEDNRKERYLIVTSDQDSENLDASITALVTKLYPKAVISGWELVSTSWLV